MTPELHALTQAEKQVEILTQQNTELWQQNTLLENRYNTAMMVVEANCRLIAEAMETLRRSARDHNELLAVTVIDERLAELWRLSAPKSNGNGNGHND